MAYIGHLVILQGHFELEQDLLHRQQALTCSQQVSEAEVQCSNNGVTLEKLEALQQKATDFERHIMEAVQWLVEGCSIEGGAACDVDLLGQKLRQR